MYKKLIMVCLFVSSMVTVCAQTNPGQQQAATQAQKMKDSLGLTTVQKDSIYQINLRLIAEKHQVRSQYTADPALLRSKTQEVENTRDARYDAILTNEQYVLYKQKKRSLLRAE